MPNLTEWGLIGALIYLVAREGLSWFREKETSETALVNNLIANQQRILERLLEVQQYQHQDFKDLKQAILGFGEKLEKAVELQNRAITQFQGELNSQRTSKDSK